MGLTRILFWVLVIGAGWLIYRRIRRFLLLQRDNPSTRTPTQVNMVRCRYCGTHIPEREAVIRQDRIYCCVDHANKG